MRRNLGTVGLALVILVAGACAGSDPETLPTLELSTLDGGSLDLAAVADDGPVLLNLWATWCTPCRRELPAFDRVATDMADEITVIGINQGDEPDVARAMLDELDIGFAQVTDELSEVGRELGVTNMPSTVFVAEGGEIVAIHPGELDAGQLVDRIGRHLGVTMPSTG